MIWNIPGVYTEPYALRDSLGAVKHRCVDDDRRGGEYSITGLKGDYTFLVHYSDDSESIFTLNFEG